MEYDKRRDINLKNNPHSLPPLHRGAYTGDLELVKSSVRNGALINEVICGFTALDRSLRYNKENIVEYLLSITETSLSTPDQLIPSLVTAVQFSTISIIQRLLNDHRVDVNEGKSGQCALLAACSMSRADSVKLLLELPPHRKLKKGCANDASMTPSHYACIHGNMSIILLLIEHDCFDPLIKDNTCMTPLGFACIICQKAFKSITQNFLEFIDIKSHIDELVTLLYWAVVLEKSNVVCILSQELEKYINIKYIEKLSTILLCARRMITGKDMLHSIFPLWWRAWAQWRGLVLVFNHTVETEPKKGNRLLEVGACAQYKSLRTIYEYGTDAQGTDLTLSMLYFVILDGFTELVKLILEMERGLKAKHFLKVLPDRGINLLNLSTKYESIHVILVKRFRFRHVLKEAEGYKLWYQKKRWLSLTVRSTAKQPAKTDKQPTDVVKIIDEVKVCLAEVDRNSEKQLVIDTMKALLRDVNRIVSRDNRLFRFKPQLVGSSNEGTRPFYPDEYDFLQVFTVLEKHVRIEPDSIVETICKVYPTTKALDDPLIRSCIASDGQLNFVNFKTQFDLATFKAFGELFSSNNRYGSYLYRDLSLYEIKKISGVHLRWRGQHYKDMPISVDLVAAIRFRNFAKFKEYTSKPCKYYVFCKQNQVLEKNIMEYPVAFSDVEQTLMRSFSQNARNGFMLSKAIRLSILMESHTEFSEDVSNLHDCLKTYMLKTCLVIVHRRLPEGCLDLEPEQWAILVYQQLLEFVHIGELQTLFSSDNEGDVALFSCKHDWLHLWLNQEQNAACCTTRMDIFKIAVRMLRVLEKYCHSKGIKTDPVQLQPLLEYMWNEART